MDDFAGKYLRNYEQARYSFFERTAKVFLPASITVPAGAVEFPDESYWGGLVDFNKFATKTKAAIFRLGQGMVKDREWERNYEEAKARGIKVGAYHFYDGSVTPQAQAGFVVDALKGKQLDMELFADYERNTGAYPGLSNVVKFMQSVEGKITAKDVGLYSGYYWLIENSNAQRHAAEFAYLRRKPLWLGWYASAAAVKIPRPFETWTHWQYGTPSRGYEFGVNKIEIDINLHNGNALQFANRYGESEPKARRVVITGDFEITEE